MKKKKIGYASDKKAIPRNGKGKENKMKVKVTKKEIRENYNNIITIGYCNAQFMLRHLAPDYYSAGTCGWSCDYYKINNNTIISTGYSPIKGIENYNIVKKYEKKAEKINHNNNYNWNTIQKKLAKNLNNFIKEILESGENK